MFTLLIALLPLFSHSLSISFSVQVSRPKVQELQFTVHEGQNPLRALRKICYDNNIFRASCGEVIRQLFASLNGTSRLEIEESLRSYDDDIIVGSPNGSFLPFAWGKMKLHINLSQLGASEISAELLFPAYSYELIVHSSIVAFCKEHSVSRLHCRELYYEVSNYLTSLYTRPKGITLNNLLAGMYYQEDLDYMYVYVDFQDSLASRRLYFAQYPSHYVESICNFCMNNNLNRGLCTNMAEYVNTCMLRYYGYDSLELWSMLYVMRSINTIVSNRSRNDSPGSQHVLHKSTETAVGERQSSDYVDADFIEIGTSNFNTITQLIDDTDGLVGFAIEPSLHYLNSLPNKQGVTKANCAIVSAQDAAQGVKTVDFYYIPEHIIAEKGLQSFLKGCNSVGNYHPYHVALGLQAYVVIEKVHAYSLESFLQLHKIRRIRLLKIDAEGYDVVIMEELYQYMVVKKDTTLYPERILFETNVESQKPIVTDLIRKFVQLGYIVRLIGSDTVLELDGLM